MSESTSRDEFLSGKRAEWGAAMRRALGDTPAARTEWTAFRDILEVLNRFTGSVGHTHLPTGGGQDMKSFAPGPERFTIEMRPARNVAYVCKPEKLTVHYFEQAPGQSFVYLTCAPLDQTRVYDHKVEGSEELVDVGRGDYRERAVWDQGFIGHDEYGEEIPLGDARLVVRFLGGNFMIAGVGSVWNGSPHTYDGEHDKLGDDEVRALIQRAIDHLNLTD